MTARWKHRLQVAAVVLILAGGFAWQYVAQSKKGIGAPCQKPLDCVGSDARCFDDAQESYCSRTCKLDGANRNCPAGWTCDVAWEEEANGETSDTDWQGVCKKPSK